MESHGNVCETGFFVSSSLTKAYKMNVLGIVGKKSCMRKG